MDSRLIILDRCQGTFQSKIRAIDLKVKGPGHQRLQVRIIVTKTSKQLNISLRCSHFAFSLVLAPPCPPERTYQEGAHRNVQLAHPSFVFVQLRMGGEIYHLLH